SGRICGGGVVERARVEERRQGGRAGKGEGTGDGAEGEHCWGEGWCMRRGCAEVVVAVSGHGRGCCGVRRLIGERGN
ncbi:hypothetical protein KI387_019335, partial [Taxus chinensis]